MRGNFSFYHVLSNLAQLYDTINYVNKWYVQHASNSISKIYVSIIELINKFSSISAKVCVIIVVIYYKMFVV